jgi:hypothetical protein
VQLRAEDMTIVILLLGAQDVAIGVVVEEYDHNGDLVFHRRRQLLGIVEKTAIADHSDHLALWLCEFGS